ncbi:MAG: pantetheine-phosphate adenylyltransferase [Flavobacteriales bacterium]
MSKTAVFPGSFDPFTRGHDYIVHKSLQLFDKVVIAIGSNSTKQPYFPLEKREEALRKLYAGEKRIQVLSYQGLTVDLCQKINAAFIVRGLRNGTDFEYEKSIAQMNSEMNKEIETVFLLTASSYAHIQSTIVREIIRNGGDISAFIPKGMELK